MLSIHRFKNSINRPRNWKTYFMSLRTIRTKKFCSNLPIIVEESKSVENPDYQNKKLNNYVNLPLEIRRHQSKSDDHVYVNLKYPLSDYFNPQEENRRAPHDTVFAAETNSNSSHNHLTINKNVVSCKFEAAKECKINVPQENVSQKSRVSYSANLLDGLYDQREQKKMVDFIIRGQTEFSDIRRSRIEFMVCFSLCCFVIIPLVIVFYTTLFWYSFST